MSSCKCPTPPGGLVSCREDQLAVCGYIDGELRSGCYDKLPAIRMITNTSLRRLAIENWVLEFITGQQRQLSTPVSGEERLPLLSGSYINPRTNTDVRLALPKDIELLHVPSNVPADRPAH